MSNYFKLQNGSDVRGVALEGVAGESVNLTNKETYYLAISFATWLSVKLDRPVNTLKVAIGCDSRLSADSLKTGIFSGLAKLGVTPVECGITSTPSTFMSTIYDDINSDGGIMITASHLPFNKNGMKFFTKDGGLNKTDIKALITGIDESILYEENLTTVESFDLVGRYSSHIVDIIRKGTGSERPLEGMKIIVDAGNGAGGFFAPKVLEVLGADTKGSQFLDPDGKFPNHIPNPEDKDAINSIIKATLATKADLGIIFDTDVDRAAVIDNTGKAINRNKLIALMSAITLDENPGSTIVTDSVTSDGLTTFIESIGGKHHRYRRGYKNVIDESIRLNEQGILSTLAIETSGHGAFSENYFLDDGAYIVTKILIKLALLKKDGKNISDLIETLVEPKDEVAIRVKIDLDEFADYGKNVLAKFNELVTTDDHYEIVTPNHEGIRVNYNFDGVKGWILVRMSLHDPVIPINIESIVDKGCDEATKRVKEFLSGFDKLVQ